MWNRFHIIIVIYFSCRVNRKMETFPLFSDLCYDLTVKTIKDIAKELGIAPSTISRVLNNSGYYSKEVEEKVRKYVEETGFIYNQSAKKLRSKRSNTIGLIIPDISNDFFSRIALIVDTFFSNREFSIFICNTGSDASREINAFRQLIANQVDGIIFDGYGSGLDEQLSSYNIPLVAIDRPYVGKIPATEVYSNDRDLSQKAAELLMNKGCRNIRMLVRGYNIHSAEFITNDIKFDGKNGRTVGFIEKILEKNPDADLKNLVSVVPYYRGLAVEESEKTVTELMKEDPDIDGFFCISDNIAYGTVRALQKAGISVPGQVKVVGFDNNIFSSISSPSITSADRNVDTMTYTACLKLLEKIEFKDKEHDNEKIIIDGTLIERETT